MERGMEMKGDTYSVSDVESGRFTGKKVHLIGIGGSGMRALGRMLLERSAILSGSDMVGSGTTQRLREQGADVRIGQRAENIPDDCDVVVYSAAIHDQNPELVAARSRDLDVMKYSQMLGELMRERLGIAVAGTHGKSTTSAMVAYALRESDADPSFIIGATVEQLGGPSGVGSGRYFVAEACEFDRSFLNLRPRYAAILNIEEDHLDCYADLSAIVEAFRAFAGQVDPAGVLIANGEDREVSKAVLSVGCEVQTFGLTDGCTWCGANLSSDRGCFAMDVRFGGERFCTLTLSIPGLHNAYNALAATGLLYHAGLESEEISKSLAQFRGVHRRLTLKAQTRDITVVDDYAHHPTEIEVSLRALRERYKCERLLCVFQPHQHSRTRFLLKDFARSFGLADEVIVPDIFFVRDSAREKDYISSEDLVAQIRLHGGSARYCRSFREIVDYLQGTLQSGDLMVTMGAGNIWEVADETVQWLGRDRQDG